MRYKNLYAAFSSGSKKRGNRKERKGWIDKYGNVWIWDSDMHGKEGWVVEYPGRRGHRHEYPDGHVREHIKRAIEYKKPSFWKIFGAGAILTFVLLDDAFGVVADEPLAAECFIMLYPDAVEYYYCDICGEKWYD